MPGKPSPSPAAKQRLRAVATTTILGDVIHNIAAQEIQLNVLIPPGVDPHGFEPTPQDIVLIADADLIFINGAGLETFLDRVLENANNHVQLISLAEQIDLLTAPEEDTVHLNHPPEEVDPHIWFDPHNVILWVDQIEQVLTDKDPSGADIYQRNAAAYRAALLELDTWISEQVQQIPESNRKLVTDHLVFGYFAQRYGFEQVGAIIPNFNAMAEPSAQEIAALEDTITRLGIQAIFIGTTANPSLARRIAEDTGVQVVSLYTGGLSDSNGPAKTYLEYMYYNVSVITQALK